MAVARVLRSGLMGRFIEIIGGVYAIILGVYPNVYGLLVVAGFLLLVFSSLSIIRSGWSHIFKPGIVGLSFSLIIIYGYALFEVVGSTIFSSKYLVIFVLVIGAFLSVLSILYELLS